MVLKNFNTANQPLRSRNEIGALRPMGRLNGSGGGVWSSLSAKLDRALRAIVEAPQCWCKESSLGRKGHSVATLEQLRDEGWIELWHQNREGKPLSYRSWALTPWAAEALGLVAVEARGIPFWAPAQDLHPSVARRVGKERRLSFPNLAAPQKKARKGPAQYLASIFWVETTQDISRAERILGSPVEIDERV